MCRFLGVFSEAETSVAIGISERTLRREWSKARAWVFLEFCPDLELRVC